MGIDLIDTMADVCRKIAALPMREQVSAINDVRRLLHEVSPFRDEPVDLVQWVDSANIEANDYNPNKVAPPEMRLLEISIMEDGYTQPIVTYAEGETHTVVDGFHRNRIGKESIPVRDRVKGYLPIVEINGDRQDKADRMAATIRHNRARGKHTVSGMSEIIVELSRRNWSDTKIAKHLGMEPDEVLRLKQISGLAEMFADEKFSAAWE